MQSDNGVRVSAANSDAFNAASSIGAGVSVDGFVDRSSDAAAISPISFWSLADRPTDRLIRFRGTVRATVQQACATCLWHRSSCPTSRDVCLWRKTPLPRLPGCPAGWRHPERMELSTGHHHAPATADRGRHAHAGDHGVSGTPLGHLWRPGNGQRTHEQPNKIIRTWLVAKPRWNNKSFSYALFGLGRDRTPRLCPHRAFS